MKLAGCRRLSDITSDLLYGDPMFRTVCFNAGRGDGRELPTSSPQQVTASCERGRRAQEKSHADR